MGFEFFSWFCGCGGGSSGLERAGGRGMLAADLDQTALASHSRNSRTPTLRADLSGSAAADFAAVMRAAGVRDPKSWPGVHVWTSPCQGFSRSGRGDPDAPENALLPLVVELCRASPSSLVIVEQVPGLLQMDGDRLRHARTLGLLFRGVRESRGVELVPNDLARYEMDASRFGVAQRRRRLIFPIPPRGGRMPGPPAPTHASPQTVREAIGSGFRDPDPEARPLTVVDRKIYQFIGPGECLDHAAEREPRLRRLVERWGPGRMYRLAWDKPSRTVLVIPKKSAGKTRLVHPEKPRFLSVGEVRELMGLDKRWVLEGDLYERYRQVGNAVCPAVMRAAAEAYLAAGLPRG